MVVKFEAVSVLTQAADPWIDLDGSLSNLSCELEKIIICLTCEPILKLFEGNMSR